MKIKKKIIIIIVFLVCLVFIFNIISTSPTIRVKYFTTIEKNRLNEIVDFMRKQYKPGVSDATLYYDGLLSISINDEATPQKIKIEKEKVIKDIRYLNDLYGKLNYPLSLRDRRDDGYFDCVHAIYDNNGNMELYFLNLARKAHNNEKKDMGQYDVTYLVYMDDNFNYTSQFKLNISSRNNIVFFKENWGTYSYTGHLG